MRKKASQIDATVERINFIASGLRHLRQDACEQIVKLGWPDNIYSDPAWYPGLPFFRPLTSSKKKKLQSRAERLRKSIVEIDSALVAMNHYAETSPLASPSNEIDASIDALAACVAAITAFFHTDADIGQKQRLSGARGGNSFRRQLPIRATHSRWVQEDAALKISNPRLSKTARSTLISNKHNAHSDHRTKPTTAETVRSAIRRFK